MKINKDELKAFLGCDDEFLVQLMETFVDESKDGMDRLKNATQGRNWKMVKATSHKMLSSTRIFNIGELSNVLEEIEEMAQKELNTELIPTKVSIVEQSWKDIIEEIAILIQKMKG